METFIEPRELVDHPGYPRQRRRTLAGLSESMIDAPIRRIVGELNKHPSCFTLQCCYGHFLYEGHWDPHNLDPLPDSDHIDRVEYRIAYLAFCLENSPAGRKLMDQLMDLTGIDPENIQFCSARWFWKRLVNTYALQVEPDRFKHHDRAVLDYEEAMYIQSLRGEFYHELGGLLGIQSSHQLNH
jgi:hypothetical protein